MTVQNIKIMDKLQAPFSFTPDETHEELGILWNVGELTTVRLDGVDIEIGTNCILFISEFYMKVEAQSGVFRMIRFNKTFINPINSMVNVGEYLMIFYGMPAVNHLPQMMLKEEEADVFENIWQDLLSEVSNINNSISEALVRNSFQRFLLIRQKKHAATEFDIPIDFKDMRLIRAFQYLVNTHFKELTKVADYAGILKVSPKKISEVFGGCYSKKVSELIASRRNLYAKRQLMHTNELIKNIAYDLNFSDSQAFSHFFKKHNGITADEYRAESRNTSVQINENYLNSSNNIYASF